MQNEKNKHVRGKTMEIPQHSRNGGLRAGDQYLRNARKRQFPSCFPPFLLTSPHVSHCVSPVSLGISYVSPSVSPCFLF